MPLSEFANKYQQDTAEVKFSCFFSSYTIIYIKASRLNTTDMVKYVSEDNTDTFFT
jgi:hypothetical protein